jgi:F-type H+-transporting ATPase subunit delta
MRGTRVATRYARSLFLQGTQEGILEKVRMDVELIQGYCSDRAFLSFLVSPIIKANKKEEIFAAIFEGGIDRQTLGFLKFLARQRREAMLPEVCKAFLEIYNTEKGITGVSLVTAVPAGKEIKDQVSKLLSGIVQGEVKMHETVDPSIIGGFILKIGDRRIDASVSNQLAQAKINLSKNVYSTPQN